MIRDGSDPWQMHVRCTIVQVVSLYAQLVIFLYNILSGFIGELLPANSSKVAVVKSHSTNIRIINADAVINIYRNPYDAMLAEFKRHSVGHVGVIDETRFNRTGKYTP